MNFKIKPKIFFIGTLLIKKDDNDGGGDGKSRSRLTTGCKLICSVSINSKRINDIFQSKFVFLLLLERNNTDVGLLSPVISFFPFISEELDEYSPSNLFDEDKPLKDS